MESNRQRPNRAAVVEFWEWFERSAASRLAQVVDGSEPIIKELDERLEGLGLSWEMGPAPGDPSAWALAISFGASLNELPSARMVVDLAPSVPGWRVILGKPPKDWDWRFSIPTSGNCWVDFDASEWRCAVEARPNGELTLLVSLGPVSPEQESVAEWAAEIAVQGAIGELAFATQISEMIIASAVEVASSPGSKCLLQNLSRELRA